MNTITSSEFRKTYPRLTEPVHVTANGHLIGAWTPMEVGSFVEWSGDLGGPLTRREGTGPMPKMTIQTRKAQQAERDRILSKINRGG